MALHGCIEANRCVGERSAMTTLTRFAVTAGGLTSSVYEKHRNRSTSRSEIVKLLLRLIISVPNRLLLFMQLLLLHLIL